MKVDYKINVSPPPVAEVVAFAEQCFENDTYIMAKLVACTGENVSFPLLPLAAASPLIAVTAADAYNGVDCVVIHLVDFSINIIKLFLDYIMKGEAVHTEESVYQLHELCSLLRIPHSIETSRDTAEVPKTKEEISTYFSEITPATDLQNSEYCLESEESPLLQVPVGNQISTKNTQSTSLPAVIESFRPTTVDTPAPVQSDDVKNEVLLPLGDHCEDVEMADFETTSTSHHGSDSPNVQVRIRKDWELIPVVHQAELLKSKMSVPKQIQNKPKGEFRCSLCNRSFGRKNLLTYHVKIHHLNQEKLQCELCQKIFSSPSVKNRHIETIHQKIKREVCPHCGKTLCSDGALKEHMKTHTGEKPFICTKCGFKSSKKFNLRRHVLSCSLSRI